MSKARRIKIERAMGPDYPLRPWRGPGCVCCRGRDKAKDRPGAKGLVFLTACRGQFPIRDRARIPSFHEGGARWSGRARMTPPSLATHIVLVAPGQRARDGRRQRIGGEITDD